MVNNFYTNCKIDSFFSTKLLKKKKIKNYYYFRYKFNRVSINFSRNIINKDSKSEFDYFNTSVNTFDFTKDLFENTFFSYIVFLNKYYKLSYYIKKNYKFNTIDYYLISFSHYKKNPNFLNLTLYSFIFTFFKANFKWRIKAKKLTIIPKIFNSYSSFYWLSFNESFYVNNSLLTFLSKFFFLNFSTFSSLYNRNRDLITPSFFKFY